MAKIQKLRQNSSKSKVMNKVLSGEHKGPLCVKKFNYKISEDQKIIQMKMDGFKVKEIASVLDRRVDGVRDRWRRYLKDLDIKSLEYVKKMSSLKPEAFLVFS